jgi:hypothetical protein
VRTATADVQTAWFPQPSRCVKSWVMLIDLTLTLTHSLGFCGTEVGPASCWSFTGSVHLLPYSYSA